MSVSDIEEEMAEIHVITLSKPAISFIANRVTQSATGWQNQPLETTYLIV